jgi:hypothetical protein
MIRVQGSSSLPRKELWLGFANVDGRETFDGKTVAARAGMWFRDAANILDSARVTLSRTNSRVTECVRVRKIKPGFRFALSGLHRRMVFEAKALRQDHAYHEYPGSALLVFLVDLDGSRGWHASRSGYILMDSTRGRGSTLAHEIGHWADLRHHKDPNRLMKTGRRTGAYLTRRERRMINTAVRSS